MKTLLLLVLVFGGLFFFNPDMEDFKAFVSTRSEALLGERMGSGALGEALSAAGSRLAGRYVDRVTERNDYLVFSTYTVDLDGADSAEEDWRFLGVAGQFIETQRPASLEEEN